MKRFDLEGKVELQTLEDREETALQEFKKLKAQNIG